MQKFRQVYQKFWDENKIENYIKCLGPRSNEKSLNFQVMKLQSTSILRRLFNSIFLCLKNLDKDQLSYQDDRRCAEEFLSHLIKNKHGLLAKLKGCSEIEDIHFPLTSNTQLIQSSFLSWVFIMEWVSTRRLTEENTLKLGLKSWELKYEYNKARDSRQPQSDETLFKSKVQKNSFGGLSQGFKVENKRRKLDPISSSHTGGSFKGQKDSRTLLGNFQNGNDLTQTVTRSEVDGESDEQRNSLKEHFVTSDHLENQHYPPTFQGSVPFSPEEEFLTQSFLSS
ncbi:hypothetical protein HMI54_005457 [Coelomomyces lativittatus]|nr:hypothetical protein HMI54_005457 [Coelomomyces lativittatus]